MFSLRKSSKLVLAAVVIIFLLLFLHYIRVLRPIENGLSYLTRPILGAVYGAANWVGNKYLRYESRQELWRENKDLKDQLAILIKEKSRFLLESEENEFLRAQLRFTQSNQYDFVIARVIGKNADNTQNSLIIDQGEKQSLRVGLPVVVGEGMLIGKVTKVNKTSALVLLINDDLSKVAVQIQNQARTMGVIEGEYGLGIRMKLIPQFESIKENDLVVTSGLEHDIPRGLIVGQIKAIKNEPEELFQEASVESVVDFNKITLVNVIKQRNN